MVALASCGSQKSAVNPRSTTAPTINAKMDSKEASKTAGAPATNATAAQLAFVQKVSDRRLYAQNITGKMTFRLQSGDKDISVPGALRMRKDKVIRIQLFVPILGSEVGRLEFTPDYVLVVDRIHKQYIKTSYKEATFLSDNGITFYSLQALYWNQLLLPGKNEVGESDLKQFDANLQAAGDDIPVTYKKGNMTYEWGADKTTGRIDNAKVTYKSAKHGTSVLTWLYDDFRAVGVKQFPAMQKASFVTTATGKKKEATVTISMNNVGTDSDWEPETTVSSKYKQVELKDILAKLGDL